MRNRGEVDQFPFLKMLKKQGEYAASGDAKEKIKLVKN